MIVDVCVCVNNDERVFVCFSSSFFFLFDFRPTKKKPLSSFFFVSDNKNLPKTDEREKKKRKRSRFLISSYFAHVFTTTHLLNIMFAATQQIASVAGLKATKVQVRRVASHRRGDDFDTSILPTAFFFVF